MFAVVGNVLLIKHNHQVRIATYAYYNTEYITDITKSSDMLSKNTYVAKRGKANQKQQLSDYT